MTHQQRLPAARGQGSAPPWTGNAAGPAGQAGEAGMVGVVGKRAREPHFGCELTWFASRQAGRRPAVIMQPGGRAWHPSFIPKERGHPWRLGLPWWHRPQALVGLLITLQDGSGGAAGPGGYPPGP